MKANCFLLVLLFTIVAVPVGAGPNSDAKNRNPKSNSQPLHCFGGRGDSITSACFSHDGKHLFLAVAQKNALQIVSTLDWHTEHIIPLNQTPIIINVSFDGKSLIVGGSRGLTIWDTSRWQPKQHFGSLENFLFLPDGRMLLVGKKGSVLLSEGKQTAVPNSKYWGDFIGLAVSPNGKTLALGGDGWLKVLDTKTWKTTRYSRNFWKDEYHDNDWVRYIAFSPNSDLVAAAAGNCQDAIVWNTTDWHRAYTLHQEAGFSSIQFASNNAYLLTVGVRLASPKTELNLWSNSDGKFITSINDHFRELGMPVSAFLSPDSRMVATETEANCVVVWNVPHLKGEKPLLN